MWFSKKEQEAIFCVAKIYLNQGKLAHAITIIKGLIDINPYQEEFKKALKKISCMLKEENEK